MADTLNPATVAETHSVAVIAKFLGPTNTRGGRIKVQRGDHRTGDPTLTVEWDHGLDMRPNYEAAILAFLAKLGWGGTWAMGSTETGYVAVQIERETYQSSTDEETNR